MTSSSIRIINGELFDPFDPVMELVTPEVIAHALGNLCRYGGHVPRFYSVAEHSIYVSRLVMKQTLDTKLALVGLLHDAEEGLGFVDMPNPVKKKFVDYRTAGEALRKAVCDHYGLPFPFPEIIHQADKEVYFYEQEQFKLDKPEISFFSPEMAKIMWIREFTMLWYQYTQGGSNAA